MKWLALLLICVAVFDIAKTITTLIPGKKTIKMAWKHNKKQFIPLIYTTVCSLLAIIIFVDYVRRF
jgi:hypothetical protein